MTLEEFTPVITTHWLLLTDRAKV